MLRFMIVLFFWSMKHISANAGELNCLGVYYGVEGQPDYARAYECFKTEENYEMLVVMLLNGEGTKQDFAAAKNLFEKHLEDKSSKYKSPLSKALSERIGNAQKKWNRIDFCKDLAENTLQLNDCAAVDGLARKLKVERYVAELKNNQSASKQLQIDNLNKAFLKFCEADGQRVYQENIDGTIRGMAAMMHEKFLLSHYEMNLYAWIEKRSYPKLASLTDADRELNLLFKAKITESDKLYDERISSPDLKENVAEYKENKARYRKLIKDAQLAWIKYRDVWEIVAVNFKNAKDTIDAGESVKAAITAQRVKELQHDGLIGE